MISGRQKIHTLIAASVTAANTTAFPCGAGADLHIYVEEVTDGGIWRLDIHGADQSTDTFTIIEGETIDGIDATKTYHVPVDANRVLPRWVKVVPTLVSGTGVVSISVRATA